MPIIKPFNAFVFNPEKIKDMSEVLSPPYDVISPAQQKEIHERHPNNIIRIDYGMDVPGEDKYARAGEVFNKWKEEEVLVRDAKPAIYITEQEFMSYEGEKKQRRGFIALMKTEPFYTGTIYPHERTFPKHKQDRLQLFKAAGVELNPVFTIFPDPDLDALGLLENRINSSKPDVEFVDQEATTHRMWRLDDEKDVASLQALLKERPVYIADGHHRYETTLNLKRDLEEKQGPLPENHDANFALVYFAPMQAPGLTLTSPHRVLHDIPGFSLEFALDALGRNFEISKTDRKHGLEATRNSGDKHIFALQWGSEYYLLTLKPGAEENLPADQPPVYKTLDTSLCTYLILLPLIGDIEQILNHVHYIIDPTRAGQMAESDGCQATVYIAPSTMKQIMSVVETKDVLPQKSTYFYPKLITGLVIYHLNME